jgi:hypothetical protein
MSDKNNKLNIPLSKATNPAILKASQTISHTIELLPQLIEVEKIKSKLLRARYEALIKSGFSESQAFTIVSTGKAFES